MFPRLDSRNGGEGDLDLVVGRFPIGIRTGYLLRGDVTAVGLTTTRIPTKGSSGVRLTGLWAVGHVGETDITRDGSGVNLFGLLAEGELPWGSLTVGVARSFVGHRSGEGVGGGVGQTGFATRDDHSVHTRISHDVGPMQENDEGASLLAIGYSTEIGHRRDLLYASGYWTDGNFGRISRGGPSPLGPGGLAFPDVGSGGHRPGPRPGRLDSAGFAVGMQTFFADEAANWAVEVGHRQHLDDDHAGWGDGSGTALSTRAQYRLAERFLLQLDAYYAINGLDAESRRHPAAENGKDSSALRVELRVSF